MSVRRAAWLMGSLGLLVALAAWWGYDRWRGEPVAVVTLQPAPLEQWVVAPGRVAAPSRLRVGVELTGVVAERGVRDGDAVQPGQVLLRLVDDEWQARVREAHAALTQLKQAQRPQAAAAQREAEARLAQAQREVDRRRGLLAQRAVSREEVEQAEQARIQAASAADQARLRVAALAPGGPDEALLRARLAVAEAGLARTQVQSPVAGLVVQHHVEVGDLVQAGQILFEITAAGRTEVRALVDERNLSVLQVGQTATVVADAWPDAPFGATLSRLAAAVDASRGAIELTLVVDDPVPAFLRDDMTVTVNVLTARLEAALVVPRDAVRSTTDGPEVRVLVDGRVAARPVVLGPAGDTTVAVSAGLQVGDQLLLDPTWPVGGRARPVPAGAVASRAADAGEVPMRF